MEKGLSYQWDKPALLVSYYYLREFKRQRPRYVFRDWVMDSGAFSAKNSGATIDLAEYIQTCKALLETDEQLTEVFALDVIGDHRGTRQNTEAMWEAGIPAIPTFHVGTPWGELVSLARDYPKIAIGGAVGLGAKKKKAWVGQCFARVWPKAIHGFGMSGEDMILSFPFHSVDATNWELGPCAFGRWASFGKMSVRGGENRNLKPEVKFYMELERKASARWKKQLAEIQLQGPVLRLAAARHRESNATLDPPPPDGRMSLRLAMQAKKVLVPDGDK